MMSLAMAKVFLVFLLVHLSVALLPAPKWQRDPRTDKEYAVIDIGKRVDFETARAVCLAVAGNLPEPRTKEENTFVDNLLSSPFYLGLRDSGEEGVWRWESDGANVTWTYWQDWTADPGDLPEPDGDVGENCAQIVKQAFSDIGQEIDRTTWMDQPCDNKLDVVCEKSQLCHHKVGQCYFDQGLRNIVAPNLQKLCATDTRRGLERCIDEVQCDVTEQHQEQVRMYRTYNSEMCNISKINWPDWEGTTTSTCLKDRDMEIEATKKQKLCNDLLPSAENDPRFCDKIDEAFACYVDAVAAVCGPQPYDGYVRELARANLRAMKATMASVYTRPPFNCNINIPE